MAQSVVMKQSMVPMLGWIMPEPLAMAPMVTVLAPEFHGDGDLLLLQCRWS